MPSPRGKWFARISRDTVLFVIGLVGFSHEVILGTGERPTLLIICAGFMGAPVFIRADERRHREQKQDQS